MPPLDKKGEKESMCKHSMEYRSEAVRVHDVNEGWFDAKRVIIFCKNCGYVSHDQTNSNSSYSQSYKHNPHEQRT